MRREDLLRALGRVEGGKSGEMRRRKLKVVGYEEEKQQLIQVFFFTFYFIIFFNFFFKFQKN